MGIAALALWFLYERVFEKVPVRQLLDEYRIVFSDTSKNCLLAAVLVLMLVNWSVEAIKWKMMMAKIEIISFLKSLEAVSPG